MTSTLRSGTSVSDQPNPLHVTVSTLTVTLITVY